MRSFCLFAFLLVMAGGRVSACSVEEGYRVPYNFELVQKAEVIVLARVTSVSSFESIGDKNPFETAGVQLEPIRFLKGTAKPSSLALMGWRAPPQLAGVAEINSMQEAHFSTGVGGCVRQFYTPGEIVVAMFGADSKVTEATGRPIVQLFEPFARVVETVGGEGDAWVQAVEEYVKVQSGEPSGLTDRTEVLLKTSRTKRGIAAQAIVLDLETQFQGKPSRLYWKSISVPVMSLAAVPTHTEAQLFCIAAASPSVLTKSGVRPNSVRVGDKSFALEVGSPSAHEQPIMKQTEAGHIFRFAAAEEALRALITSDEQVAIVGERGPIVSAFPADALSAWGRNCLTLRSRPAPQDL